jgi:hypothetical protein
MVQLLPFPSAALVGAAGLALAGPASAAQPQFASMQGAWLQQSTTCGEVYKPSGKGLAFRKDVTAFVPGFIVAGKVLRTPVNSCRISGLVPTGDRWKMKLDCTGAVSTMDVNVEFSITPDGALLRYLNEQDKSGSRYERCTARNLNAQPKG